MQISEVFAIASYFLSLDAHLKKNDIAWGKYLQQFILGPDIEQLKM